MYNESDFEARVIELITKSGEIKYIAPNLLNQDDDEIFQIERLKTAIKKINPGISNDDINLMIRKLIDLRGSSLEIANKRFHELMLSGIKIFNKSSNKYVTYRFVDFSNKKNNTFLVTNQVGFKSGHPEYNNQYPDIIIFLNGLPIIVIELKKLDESNDLIEKAYRQIKNYQKWIEKLFVTNIFNVVSDPSVAKFGSLTSSLSRFQYWRGSNFNDMDSVETLFTDLFLPNTILEIVKNYTFYLKNTSPYSKIIAGYHQYYGVENTTAKLFDSIINKKDKKGGIFWHTQGSGKSFSMMFLVHKLSTLDFLPGTTFVIVTDRNDLDDQLFLNFSKSTLFTQQQIKQINSTKDLSISLRDLKQDGIYFTTLQKFTQSVQNLSDRNDIVIITDEAHRSHNNVDGKLFLDEENLSISKKFGSAKYIRDAFPNATFIGFTGTPIERDDISTKKIYGDYTSKYLMENAVRDGVIVPIKYEIRKPNLHFNDKEMQKLDEIARDAYDEVSNQTELDNVVRKKINKIAKSLKNFIKVPERIEGIAKDFLEHYDKVKDVTIGKAMFVSFDRETAKMLYDKILELRPEWNKVVDGKQTGPIRVVFTVNGQNDSKEMIELGGSSSYRRALASEFKDENSSFRIAVVVDMWLTGFDVPSLDVLYLDKPLKMHNLMQTIARVNRVYIDKKNGVMKERGLVVDYIGIASKLRDALEFYSGLKCDEVKNSFDIKERMKSYIDRIDLIYKNFTNNKIEIEKLQKVNEYRYTELRNQANYISMTKKLDDFVIVTTPIRKMLKDIISIASPKEIIRFNFLIVLRSYIIKINLENVYFKSIEEKIKRQLSKAIKYTNTTELSDNKNYSLLEIIDFIRQEKKGENNHLDKDEKLAATKRLLNEMRKINIVKSQNMSKSLMILMEKYERNFITLEELMKGIVIIANEALKIVSNRNKTGYSNEELAFYSILTSNLDEIPEYDKRKINIIFEKVLKIINNKELVSRKWQYNKAMSQRVRASLKEILIDEEYPPKAVDKTRDDMIAQIFEQLSIRRVNNEK